MKAAAAAVLVAAFVVVDTGAGQQAARPFEATAVPHRIETHLPPAGRVGDRDLVQWTIRDRYGRAFGSATLHCDWYHSRERMCTGVFRLARGTFAVAGTSLNRQFGELLVLSGTGDYTTPRAPLSFNATSRGKLTLRGAF